MKRKIQLRAAYDDHDELSQLTGLECRDPSLTQQSFLEEVDINYMMERFGLTGEMPQIIDLPRYENYENIFDFQSAMNVLVHAREEFMTLPAKLRARFENNPQLFHDFVLDPENKPELIKMGLMKAPPAPPEEPKPMKVEVVTPTPPKPTDKA